MSANSNMEVMNEVAEPQTADSNEKSLYKIGGAAALICAVMYVIALVIYIPAYRAGPPPGTVLRMSSPGAKRSTVFRP